MRSSDNNTDATPVCLATTLAPGASTTCTAVHTVTQAELDAGGTVSNTVLATTAQGASGTDTVVISIVQSPALTIDKTSVDTTYVAPDDVLDYSYTVTNTGNVTLSGPFTVSDDRATDESCPATATTRPGRVDHLHRELHGDPGRHRRGLGDQRRERDQRHRRPSPTDTSTIARNPDDRGLTIDKTSTTTTVTTVGQVVPYSYLVTNTGNVTLTGSALADTNTDATPGLRRDHPRPDRDHDLHRGPHRDPGRARRRRRPSPTRSPPRPAQGATRHRQPDASRSPRARP